MLLLAQIEVIRQWIVDSVQAAIDDGGLMDPIAMDRIVRVKQDFPDRAYPYVLLGYTGSTEVGISPAQWIAGDELVTRTGDDTTLSITIVSQQSDTAPNDDQLASSYVREMKARLRSFAGDSLRLAQLAIRDVNVVPDLGRLQGASQWESRAVLDITFGHAVTISEDTSIIEIVEVLGATTPTTPPGAQTPANPTGIQTIPAP